MKLLKQDRKAFYTLMLPALAENILIRIFHVVDSMMLGQMKNSTLAVAAVGLCNSPTNLIISVTSAFFIGKTKIHLKYKNMHFTKKRIYSANANTIFRAVTR